MDKDFDKFGLKGTDTHKLELTPGNIKKGMKAIGTVSDIYFASPRSLRVIEGFNPRIKDQIYWDGIRELAEGMREHGYYRDKPLAAYVAVEDGEPVVFVTEGHRRLDAALYWMDKLGAPEDLKIPVAHKPSGTSALDLNYALIESNKSKDFRPYELAMLVKRLHVAYGQSVPVIAKKMGKSEAHVHNLLLVAGAPEAIAQLVMDGELSVTEAAEAINTHKDKAVAMLAQAKANSAAEGKAKISKRFMPGQRFKSAIKKESETIFDAVRRVRTDKGFDALTPETRETVDALVTRLADVEAKLAEAEAQALAQAQEAGEAADE